MVFGMCLKVFSTTPLYPDIFQLLSINFKATSYQLPKKLSKFHHIKVLFRVVKDATTFSTHFQIDYVNLSLPLPLFETLKLADGTRLKMNKWLNRKSIKNSLFTFFVVFKFLYLFCFEIFIYLRVMYFCIQ